MTLVTIEAVRRGLVPVAGLGVHDRDNPVFCDLSGDTQDLVVALFQVLADDSREQAGRLGDNIGELTAFERQEAAIGVLRASVDETLARWGVLPVDLRLVRARIVVPARENGQHLGAK